MFSDSVISGDVFNAKYPVKNSFIWSIPEIGPLTPISNYWLAPGGAEGEFILEFDQPRLVSVIILVNTHNGNGNDRGTKEFKVNVIF